MPSDALEMAFHEMQTIAKQQSQQIQRLRSLTESSGYAFELRQLTLAEANAEIPSITGVAFVWISDGRKVGEGSPGTGVPAYLDQGQVPAVWYRFADDTAVVT